MPEDNDPHKHPAGRHTPESTPAQPATPTYAAPPGGDGPHPRGREADKPSQIPPRGWLDIATRVKHEMDEDNLGLVGAGVAFYAFLGLFPTLIAIFSIYGLVADPQDVPRQVESFSQVMPQGARDFLHEQMARLAAREEAALGWGTGIGILAALWSAARGVKALMTGLNIAYDERETRGFIKTNLTGLALTGGIILGVVMALGGIVGVPALLAAVGLGSGWGAFLNIIRWPLLAALALAVLASLYRWGPDRRAARWRWISPGAVFASLLWLGASALFSLFVQHFGNYANTYGSIAAIVVFMTWLSLSAYIVLLGAEINAEMEHQTTRDTTTSGGKPMGQRGAYVADNLGKSRHQRA